MNNVNLACLNVNVKAILSGPERIAFIFKFFNGNKKHMGVGVVIADKLF